MIYFFDVDNTVCKTRGEEYMSSTPIKSRIKKINKLADKGHKIVFWTARGAVSGIDWLPWTRDQLDSWGLRYHEIMRKPYYDLCVDDKAINDKAYFNGK